MGQAGSRSASATHRAGGVVVSMQAPLVPSVSTTIAPGDSPAAQSKAAVANPDRQLTRVAPSHTASSGRAQRWSGLLSNAQKGLSPSGMHTPGSQARVLKYTPPADSMQLSNTFPLHREIPPVHSSPPQPELPSASASANANANARVTPFVSWTQRATLTMAIA